MVKSLSRNYLINVFAFWLLPQYILGLHLAGGWKSIFLVSLIVTILHLTIKPILSAILGTLNFFTLGLVGVVIDAALLFALALKLKDLAFAAWFFPGLAIAGFTLPAYNLNQIEVTLITAFSLSLIRQFLLIVL